MADTTDLFPVDWVAGDHGGDPDDPDDPGRFEIAVFGRTPDARVACLRIDFHPYFFVEMPPGRSPAQTKLWIAGAVARHRGALPAYCVPVRRRSLWGYAAGGERQFAQLAFASAADARRARYRLARELQTYEASVDPVARLCHLRGIVPAAWLRVRGAREVPAADRRTDPEAVDLEVRAPFTALGPSDRADPPPLVIASWDIECYSASGAFPLAANRGDCLVCIGTAFQRYGEAAPYRVLVVSHGEAEVPAGDVECVSCATEADVFNEWAAALRREKADVLLSYNGNQFDWRYLDGRAQVCVDDASGQQLFDVDVLGRAARGEGTNGAPREWELNTGAYGQNKFFALATPGVLQLDLLHHLRREVKLDSYSLNAVAERFLGDRKIDLPAAEIFARFRGSAADRGLIARYCAKDTALPLRLLAKLAVLENVLEMANAVSVPPAYILERGQQVKVFSLVARKARQLGFLIPDDKALTHEGKYDGATVLDAKKGAYFDPVATLDFASREFRTHFFSEAA